jgi:hypothetical protein
MQHKIRDVIHVSIIIIIIMEKYEDQLEQCCPTFLYTGAHLTDGCGGAGAM